MDIEHLILARSSSVDGESNSLSIFELVEDITVQGLAGQITIPIQVIAVIKRTSERGPIRTSFRLTMTGAHQNEILTQEIQVGLEEVHSRNRLRLNTLLPLAGSGTYAFTLQKVDEPSVCRRIEINVTSVPMLPTVRR